MHQKPLVFAISLSAFALVSCEALQTGAPPITPTMTRIAGANGGSAQTLAEGRRLLATRCTNCHALEPITKYSVAEWRNNVRRMSGRARLDETEIQEITTYLAAARQSLEHPE